jgi:16S rRNA (guanine527-N7)-methyltransferase
MRSETETLHAMNAIHPLAPEMAERLRLYADQLRLWQRKTNLVAPSTLDNLWDRHFYDSWQILAALPQQPSRPVVDLGSGGGFPGLVMAVAGVGDVHLVEANHRKAGFLQYVAAQMGVPVTVHAMRIEDVKLRALAPAAAITARACAALEQLLAWAHPLVDPDTQLVFLKGQSWRSEIVAAEANWSFAWNSTPSVTEPDAAIVTITRLEPRTPDVLS